MQNYYVTFSSFEFEIFKKIKIDISILNSLITLSQTANLTDQEVEKLKDTIMKLQKNLTSTIASINKIIPLTKKSKSGYQDLPVIIFDEEYKKYF